MDIDKTTRATSKVGKFDWRANIFRMLAALFALFMLLISAPGFLAPWGFVPSNELLNITEGQDLTQIIWYGAIWVAFASFLSAGILLLLVWKPREKALLMQFLLIIWILISIVSMLFMKESDYSSLIIIAVLLAAFPEPRALLRFAGERPWNKTLIGLGLVAVLFFAPVFYNNLLLYLSSKELQEMSVGPLQVTFIALSIPIAIFLIASQKPGWKQLSIIAGLALLYLGFVAITVPNIPGSWGLVGGILSLVGGLAFLTSSRWAIRLP